MPHVCMCTHSCPCINLSLYTCVIISSFIIVIFCHRMFRLLMFAPLCNFTPFRTKSYAILVLLHENDHALLYRCWNTSCKIPYQIFYIYRLLMREINIAIKYKINILNIVFVFFFVSIRFLCLWCSIFANWVVTRPISPNVLLKGRNRR